MPEIDYAFLADFAKVEANGTLTAIGGSWTALAVPQFPSVHRFAVAGRVRALLVEDHVPLRITVSTPQEQVSIEHNELIQVDLDEFGVAVGIEILDEGAELPFQALIEVYHVHSDDVELLRLIRPSVAGYLDLAYGSDGESVASGDRTFATAS